ncbi:MAG: thioredoxin family protein [Fibrobacter sp.]|jgi:thioredoxin-related protein|nr:thioredoxin family protein [Fibrobacter sp.]
MKKMAILFLIGGSVLLYAAQIQWVPYTQALEQTKKEPRLIWAFLQASWCIPCRVMEREAFTDSGVIELLNTRFYPVRLDVESKEIITCDGKKKTVERCFFDVWELNGTPSMVLIAPKGLSILTLSQALSAKDLSFLLNRFLENEKEWLQP